MAAGKKSFVLYTDYEELFSELSNEDAGQLIKHIFGYVNDKNPVSKNPIVNVSFIPIKLQLKRDLVKWDSLREKRSEAGKASAEAKKNKTQQVSTSVDFVAPVLNSVEQTSTKSTVTVNATVTEINNNIPPIEKIDWDALIIKFNLFFNKKTKLINKSDRAKFNARLKDGWTKNDIAAAMESIRSDPFHKEEGYKHVTYEYLSRDGTLQRHATKSENTDRIINDSWEAN